MVLTTSRSVATREHLTEKFVLRNVLTEVISALTTCCLLSVLNIVNRLRDAKTFELTDTNREI